MGRQVFLHRGVAFVLRQVAVLLRVGVVVVTAGDQLKAIAERVPAHVMGDGSHTVSELVEITNADKGKVVARIRDRYCRFLTAGDIDGDILLIFGTLPSFTRISNSGDCAVS